MPRSDHLFITLIVFLLPVMALAAPDAFELLSPSNTSTAVSVWPEFEWTEATDTETVTYSIFISTTPDFADGTYVVYEDIEGTRFRPPVDLEAGPTNYLWKVVAINEGGEETWATTGTPFGFWAIDTIPLDFPREIRGYETIEFDRTLIAHNTPYNLRFDHLEIPQGLAFGLQAGTTMEIESGLAIVVSGELQALGAPSDSVRFVPAVPLETWNGISFYSTASATEFEEDGQYIAGSRLSHCTFGDVGSSFTIFAQSSSVYVDNCLIQGSIEISGSVASALIDNMFRSATGSTQEVSLFGDGNLILRNDLSESILSCQGNYLRIIENHVHDNGSDGAIRVSGNNVEIASNSVADCVAYGGNLWNYGGVGISFAGDYSQVVGNTIDRCTGSYGSTLRGVGMYLNGDGLTIRNNVVRDCLITGTWGGCEGIGAYIGGEYSSIEYGRIEGCRTESDDYGNAWGGGLFLDGSYNTITGLVVIDNVATRSGGGIYVDNWAATTMDSLTVSGNTAWNAGGGIYFESNNGLINYSTVTNNEAHDQAGGIYRGGLIHGSTIKYNSAGETGRTGGVVNSAGIQWSNLNNNSGYQYENGSSGDVEISNNWWFTRSDLVMIEDSTYDAYETDNYLGVAYYQPILEDVSPVSPLQVEVLTGCTLMADTTFTAPLSEPLHQGDALCFQFTAEDRNPYNRDVITAWVENWSNFWYIQPYFEETGNNTGVFRCVVQLSDHMDRPFTILAEEGHRLVVYSDLDPDLQMTVVLGESPIGVEDDLGLPPVLLTEAPYPNPFNPQVNWRFMVPERRDVVLEVLDLRGRVVARRPLGELDAGQHMIGWNGKTDRGTRAASGSYLLRLRAGSEQVTRRVVLVK